MSVVFENVKTLDGNALFFGNVSKIVFVKEVLQVFSRYFSYDKGVFEDLGQAGFEYFFEMLDALGKSKL